MLAVWPKFIAEPKARKDFSRQLVIKRILPHLADDENFITMFEDEARLAARLSHPHAVRVEEFAQAGDVWYLAMEYLDGGDLRYFTALRSLETSLYLLRSSLRWVGMWLLLCTMHTPQKCSRTTAQHDPLRRESPQHPRDHTRAS